MLGQEHGVPTCYSALALHTHFSRFQLIFPGNSNCRLAFPVTFSAVHVLLWGLTSHHHFFGQSEVGSPRSSMLVCLAYIYYYVLHVLPRLTFPAMKALKCDFFWGAIA